MTNETEQVSGETAVETKPANDFVLHGEETTETAVEAPVEEGTQPEEDSQDKPNEEGKKPKRGGFQKKIGRLEAERDFYRQELERARSVAAPVEKPSVKSEDAALPKEDDFETFADYNQAIIKHAVAQELKKADVEKAQVQSIQSKVDTYNKLTSELKTERPDFDEVINNSEIVVTPAIKAAILDSDMGPRVALYLAENPDEAEGLENLGTIALNKKIAKIEAKLELSKPAPKVAAKTTQAPAPISPVGNGKSNVVPNTDDDFEEYRRLRMAGRI